MLAKFSDLVGQTITAIKVDEYKSAIDFTLSNGEIYSLYHAQECCENVAIEDICGNLDDLINSPILLAEKLPMLMLLKSLPKKTIRITGMNVRNGPSINWLPFKGYVTIRWYGESNGYYSTSVSWGMWKKCEINGKNYCKFINIS